MNAIDVLRERVSIADLVAADAHTLCVDGTSATCKTTVLRLTGLQVTKTQRAHHYRRPNTYFPNLIGYACRGLNTRNRGDPHLNDRSFLNPIHWLALWRIMGDWNYWLGNARPSEELRRGNRMAEERIELYRRMLLALRGSYHYRAFAERENVLAVVDSNSVACDERRAARGEGSDRERSAWAFYTELQNLMYETLYPRTTVDLAWFDLPRDQVNRALAEFIRVDVIPALFARRGRVPLFEVRVPGDPFEDPLLRNARVHARRTIANARCAVLLDHSRRRDDDDDDDYRSNDESPNDEIARRAASTVPNWMLCESPGLNLSRYQPPIVAARTDETGIWYDYDDDDYEEEGVASSVASSSLFEDETSDSALFGATNDCS